MNEDQKEPGAFSFNQPNEKENEKPDSGNENLIENKNEELNPPSSIKEIGFFSQNMNFGNYDSKVTEGKDKDPSKEQIFMHEDEHMARNYEDKKNLDNNNPNKKITKINEKKFDDNNEELPFSNAVNLNPNENFNDPNKMKNNNNQIK